MSAALSEWHRIMAAVVQRLIGMRCAGIAQRRYVRWLSRGGVDHRPPDAIPRDILKLRKCHFRPKDCIVLYQGCSDGKLCKDSRHSRESLARLNYLSQTIMDLERSPWNLCCPTRFMMHI